MQTVTEILKSEAAEVRRPMMTHSMASTSPSGAAEDTVRYWLLASEAEAAGYVAPYPAPEPKTCQFCGRTLEYRGMIGPFAPGRILMWLPNPVRCDCPEAAAFWEQHDREEAERKEKEAEREAAEARQRELDAMQEKIGKIFRDSGMGARFQNRTFSRWEINEQNRHAYTVCKQYADRFDSMLPVKNKAGRSRPPENERNGLLITGGYGAGKTHMATAIANHLMANGTPTICMTSVDLLARIRETYSRDGESTEQQILHLYGSVPLLVIDDLGSEQPTEWSSTTIFSIVNTRYEAYMPTIVTTNCGLHELVRRMTPKDATDRNAQKTVDRLREMCRIVQMNWPSWRAR